jgi:hypothetical protein
MADRTESMTTMAEACDKCGKLDANKCAECNPIRKKAAQITAEIKALVREKPTAINAYGLKSWEKIEQMIMDALTSDKQAVDVIMELHAWRNAMIGLCNGNKWPTTPDEAAAHLRARLHPKRNV